ncbi:MAG: dihydroneopterin aldolase [Candidatus Bathyarchaeota archaeon]|nr:dihydroneopterin aldolase [Candidatus Bathyarchaeota archaeon]
MNVKPKPDKVFVKNLVLPCSVGVYEEEQKTKQNVIIDIEISCSLAAAGASDELENTVDYATVQEKITHMVTTGQFKLLETLAENIASWILKNTSASQVTVTVKKEKYAKQPIMGIEITRDQLG